MQLYALDEKENLIYALQGRKQKDYFCRECRGVMRCRSGFVRQMHFYHLKTNRFCRQSGKSATHFQIQQYLQKKLPGAELEKIFTPINRIADVVWEQEKMVFEIQCSSITAREIEERNRDYESVGYKVTWILHDRLFNKTRLTAAEFFLLESPHYFTNINVEGEGLIYDQWNLLEKGRRLKVLGFREIHINAFSECRKELLSNKNYPKWVYARLQSWPVYFSGDFLDFLLSANETDIQGFLPEKQQVLIETHRLLMWERLKEIMHFVAFPYRLTLYLIMDKLSR